MKKQEPHSRIQKRKLVLDKERVRILDVTELVDVAGGCPPTDHCFSGRIICG